MNHKLQKGQALVEMAITLPLLIVLILAIGYFGHAITTQQTLYAATRYAMRVISMESTSKVDYRTNGSYTVTQERIKELLLKALPNADKDRIIVSEADPPQGLKPIKNTFKFVYIKEELFSTNLPLHSSKVGIGTIFYGAKVSYRLKELDLLAKLIGLKEGITISATVLMPAELPLRGGYGLLDINPWISNIVTEDVGDASTPNTNYKNLVD